MNTQKSSTDFILDTSREYSIYVCQSRGIPNVTDGLKDAQRKALFVMKSKNEKLKTVSLAGEMISANIYLHGDTSATDTISMMAAPYCNNVMLLHGIGGFGTRADPTDWAAPRYTYVKKSSFTESLIYHDYEIIPMKENYDGSVLEPKHFLPLIPMVLLNGISGIGVGWSTKILPHSLDDLINSTLAAIDNKKKLPELLPNYNYLNSEIKVLAENSYEFYGKVKIEGNMVTVTELPPDINLEQFKTRLNKFEDEEKIHSYVDRSTDNIKIEVKFKRGVIDDWSEADVINYLKLRSKISERIIVIDWDGNGIKQYSNTDDLIKDFVEWRLGFYTIRYTKWIKDSTYSLNWYLALKECYDQGLPAFLSKANNKSDVIEKIEKMIKKIQLSEDQIDRISSLPSYRWAKDSYQEVLDKINEIQNTIADYQSILADPTKMRAIYRKEVSDLKKLPKIER